MNKKVCLITPSLKRGGMERVLCLLANYAESINIKISIICLIEPEVAYPLNKNIKLISPQKAYRGGFLEKIRVMHFLRATLILEKPDAVLSFSEVFNPLSIISAKLSGSKVFISDRSSPEKKLPYQTSILRRLLYPFAKGLVCQTELSKTNAKQKKLNKNIKVISNPLRKINDSYTKKNEKIVLSMGRLVSSKNFTELIDIFLQADQKKEWKLLILGEGPERGNIENKIAALNENDRIKLIGAVDDVDYYFASADIFAFTSLSEGFPNALSEAVAFPLASISYDCSAGPSEIIDDGSNGFLIPMGNNKLYVEKLTELMSSNSLRKRMTDRHLEYRKKLHQDIICSEYLDFILQE